MGRRVLVIGGTGLVGGYAVAELRAMGAGVTSLVRRGAGAEGERVVDFARLGAEETRGFDELVCALGTTMKKAGGREAFRAVDYELPLRVARFAREGGARRMALVSSVGADPKSSSFYLRTKGELEEALSAIGFETLHVMRPSFLVGERGEARVGESIGIAAARMGQGLLRGGLRKYRPVSAEDVGRALARCLARRANERRVIYEYDAIREVSAQA